MFAAPLLTAVTTHALAREFPAADTQSEDYPNRTNVALIGTFVPATNVPAAPFLFRSIEHLQKVLDGPARIRTGN
jgi:hypothetical protein